MATWEQSACGGVEEATAQSWADLLQRDEGELASADGAAAHEAAETLLAQHTRPVTSPLGSSGSGTVSGHATRDRDKRLVVVANRLPVTLNKGADGAYTFKMSSGGLVSALVSVRSKVDFIWIGWLGKEVPPADQAGVRKRLIDEFQCCPVFLSDALAGPYYNTMANAELWPHFHYETKGPREEPLDWAAWDAYVKANGEFCDVVASVAKGGDLVWVHDYHLTLLPLMLRARVPGVTLGWFLHTPFPASSTFRALPVRHELLTGLLACDVLGFHTFDYCRHFASSCGRLLPGVTVTPTAITLPDGWTTDLMVDPIGIEPADFAKIAAGATCQARIADLRRQFEGVRVIVAVDRLDPIKGVPHRLLGLRRFFATHPEWVGHVTLIQIAVPSRVDVEAYRRLAEDVNTLVGAINGEFSTLHCQAVHYFFRSIAPEELCALYTVGDVALITSLRDGMNLVAEEYVACQRMRETAPGVLILSEFAGAAQSLPGALPVNPWDPASVSEAIHEAVVMSREERVVRWRQLHDHIEANTSQHWALAFVNHMARLQKARDSTSGTEAAVTAEELLAAASSPGAGVLVVLDADVLWPLEDEAPSATAPEVLKRLHVVASDARVTGVVVTSRSMAAIDDMVRAYPALHVVAESGCCVRLPVLMRLPPTSEVTSSVGRALAKQLASTEYPLSFHGGGRAAGGSRPRAADLFAAPRAASADTPQLPNPSGGPATPPVHAVRLAGGLTPRARERGGLRDRTTSVGSTSGSSRGMDHLPRAAAVGARWFAVCPEVEGAPARTLQSPHVAASGSPSLSAAMDVTADSLSAAGPADAPSASGTPPPSWKSAVRTVMARFVESTPGARVAETLNTVQLLVGGVDPELEAWQCKQLGLELELLTTAVPVDAVLSRSGVLVRPQQGSLSHALTHIVDDIVMQGCPPPATVVAFAAARDSHRIVADSMRMEPVLLSLQAACRAATTAPAPSAPAPGVSVRFASLIHPHFDVTPAPGATAADAAAPPRGPSPAAKHVRLPSDATAMRLRDLADLLHAAAGAVGAGAAGAGTA